MMRVGVLHGGLEVEADKAVPPSQKLRIIRSSEMTALASPPLASPTIDGHPQPSMGCVSAFK